MADQGPEAALVLFSGGQDSSTSLAWALSRYDLVETVGFDYGQKHRVELDARQSVRSKIRAIKPAWEARLGDDHLISLDIPSPEGAERDGLPATFVPGRNLLFFLRAAILAEGRNIRHIVGGMCETDFSGYPDCRNDAIQCLQVAVNIGMQARLIFETPLMWIDKAQSWWLAAELGGERLVDLIREETRTCYKGEGGYHDWGRGCGACAACQLRCAGWRKFCREMAS